MKKLIFIPILLFLLVSCTGTKKSIHANDPKFTLDTITSTIDSVSVAHNVTVETMNDMDEGIGTGSIGTIGHGMGGGGTSTGMGYGSGGGRLKTTTESRTLVYSSAPSQPKGEVIYNIPKTMKVRETYLVTVRIGKASIEIRENMETNGVANIRTAVIPITETMEVKLIDPSPDDYKAFEIVADNDGVQMVDTTGSFTQWTWNVTPIKVGTAKLKIMVSIIKNGNKKEEVYQDVVKVEASAGNQIKFFFHKYWQWLFATLLIPIFKYFWGIWKKKDDEEDKPKKKTSKPRKKW